MRILVKFPEIPTKILGKQGKFDERARKFGVFWRFVKFNRKSGSINYRHVASFFLSIQKRGFCCVDKKGIVTQDLLAICRHRIQNHIRNVVKILK